MGLDSLSNVDAQDICGMLHLSGVAEESDICGIKTPRRDYLRQRA